MTRWFAIVLGMSGCQYLAVDNGDAQGPGDDDDDLVGDDDDNGPSDVDCSAPYATPTPGDVGEGECVTDVISCGDTVFGSNLGGSTMLSNAYDQAFEWCSGLGEGDHLDGPERVYLLEPPSDVEVLSVRLGSCAASRLLWYQTSQVCPQERVLCQYANEGDDHDQWEDILLSGSGTVWFVVEGLDNDGGNFSLTVDCL